MNKTKKHECKTHASSRVFKHSDRVTKRKHHVICLICHYFRESVVLRVNAALSVTVAQKNTTSGMKTDRVTICWGRAETLRMSNREKGADGFNVSSWYRQIHGGGMRHYLCFFMPFFCGTDVLFFRLPPSTSASLKLDSDPPSQDSSESKPKEERRLQLWQNKTWIA